MSRLAALLALAAAPVSAQEVIPCDWQASAQAIIEPWEDNSRAFANGAVRLAALDTVEPALGWAYLLVLTPPFNDLGDRQCRVVAQTKDLGFAGIDFSSLKAGYDPATGLTFQLTVSQSPNGVDLLDRTMTVTVNQSTGAVTAWLPPSLE